MTITGKTRLYAILADPVAQVRTPEVFNALCARQGVDAVLVPMQVAAADLAALCDGLRRLSNFGGMIVTVPHKTAIVGLCDSVGRAAGLIGAANAVRREPDGRLTCEMFDGHGFLAGLRAEGHEPAGRRVLLIGAGGAGAAIAFALAEAGVAALAIANRGRARAETLAARVREAFPQVPVEVMTTPRPTPETEIIVNATSLGLGADDPLPLDPALLRPGLLVAEVIMKPETTALLAAAEGAGCRVHRGRHMLDQQLRLLAEFLGAVRAEDRAAPIAAGTATSGG